MIIIKFAQNLLGFIGKDNNIPWKCKRDLKDFKEATTDNIVIMGRKTFESIGSKPLPNRINIVVSMNDDYVITQRENNANTDLYFCTSLENALKYCDIYPNKNVYIIGGAMLIESAIRLLGDKISQVEISIINDNTIGDTAINRNLLYSLNCKFHITYYARSYTRSNAVTNYKVD